MMTTRLRALIVSLILLLNLCTISAQSEVEPVIVVYGGGQSEFAEMLATLIEEDGSVEGEVMVVYSRQSVELAAALPTTKCIVMYADHRNYISGLWSALVPFFKEGGGLVGMTELCYMPSAGTLATEVFPVFGNSSDVVTSPRETRTRTYVLEEETEVNAGLPDQFDVLSMGTYLSADEGGDHVRVPGDYQVAYRDEVTGCPLVAVHESERGGRSVALPGIMVVTVPRLDVYYGNLISDQAFVDLFMNCVSWASENSRIEAVEGELTETISEYEESRQDMKDSADESDRERRNRRLMTLVVLWAIGLVACAVAVKKGLLAPLETD